MSTTVNQDRFLSVEEENLLSQRWQEHSDENALKRMVKANIGLVVSIAKGFRYSGAALEDLIQEGYVGLTIAARRFDPTRGARLSTYAYYWIKAFMWEYMIRSHGPVHIGTSQIQRRIFFGLGRARRRLEDDGITVNADSLAAALGVERSEIDSMVARLANRDVSLDAPRFDHDQRLVGATLTQDGPGPEELVARLEEDGWQKNRLLDGLRVLDSRERMIIRARHMREHPATLRALSRKFGISRERVRQIEFRALAKLRQYCSE